MANILILLVVAALVGLAGRYIHREKKRGVRCVGCPSGGSCAHCPGCAGHTDNA